MSAPSVSALNRWVVGFCLIAAIAARADEGGVTLVGGPNTTGQNYEWTVTNQDRSPIVEVRIPHYHASLFLVPPEWKTDASTFIVNVGAADRPGECVARAASERDGIAPGKSAVFRVQLSASGAARGVGTVHVRFADGRETAIPGVAVPQPERLGDKYVSLIGLGGIFAVLILIQRLRRARRRPAGA